MQFNNKLRLVPSKTALVAELNRLDSFCLYVCESQKGRIGMWYLPVSRYMTLTIAEAEDNLRFLRWLRDINPDVASAYSPTAEERDKAERVPSREPWHKPTERIY